MVALHGYKCAAMPHRCRTTAPAIERFYRVDASRHGSAKNTGLGLAIVKSIMEIHRGKVDVSSDGEKTTFTLHFLRPASA